MTEEKEAHDSAYVYSSIKGRHWFTAGSKVALSERPERGRGQWIVIGLLVVVIVLGGAFFGLWLENTVVNPPKQVEGVCPAPAFIAGNQCLQRVCTTNSNGQQTCNNVPAGRVLTP